MSGTERLKNENENVAERNAGYLRALDLHDETGQLLTAILVNLQRLGKTARAPEASETLRDTQHLVETLFYSIRNFIRDAGGPSGTDRGAVSPPDLGPALRRLADEFSRRTGIEVDLRFDHDGERVPGAHKAVCYRVVQESLTNVFRHTRAGKVAIRFSRTGSSVVLEIRDDGGTRQAAPRACVRPPRAGGGSGLRGMKERVRLVGGECTVELEEGRGMTVKVVLPYNIS
jgi:two-component system sensor histidine kinase UhpB